MVRALVEKYEIRLAYVSSDGQRSECPELRVIAGLVFFLKIHYHLCDSKGKGRSNVMMRALGLPQSNHLIEWWKGKKARIVNYRRLPQKDRLPWNELDDYLHFCSLHGLEVRREKELKLQVGSYSELLYYPEKCPPWRDVELTSWQKEQFSEIKKAWQGPPEGVSVDKVMPDYALLLTLAGDLFGFTFPTLILRAVHDAYETAHPSGLASMVKK